MSRTLIVVIIVVVLAVGGWAIFGRDKSNDSSTNSSGNSSTTNTTSTGAITIKNMMFTPSQISVQKGGTVTWTNNDTVAHTVTDDLSNVGGPASGAIEPGETYSFKFEKTGSFQYHCTYHTSMRGTIVVK